MTGDSGHARLVAEMISGESSTFRVRGDCMAPALFDGQVVEVSGKKPKLGDVVVVCSQSGGFVMHRYLGKRPFFDRQQRRWRTLVVTRPDQGASFDPEVSVEDVVGVASGVHDAATSEVLSFEVGFARRCAALLWYLRYCFRIVVRGIGRRIGSVKRGTGVGSRNSSH